MRVTRAILFVLSIAATLPAARVAFAFEPDRAACRAAYETGQRLRRLRELHAAKQILLVCAQPSCPSAAQKDCTRWIAELEQEIPSIVLGARDQLGRDLEGVQVFVDSSTIAEHLDGRALELDPGPHIFKFVIEGAEPISERAVLREGEKRRAITATLAAKEPLLIPPGGSDPRAEKKTSPYFYVSGATGALGLAGFVFFGFNAQAEESRLERRCKPGCSDDEVAGLRRNVAAADVSLVIALIGAAATTYFYFAERE